MQDIFEKEIKQKKITARGASKKTNGRRSKHKMFPFDFLTYNQQKQLMKGGKVKVSNLYDELLSAEEFFSLDEEKQRAALIHWRKTKTNKKIKEALGWNDYSLYKYFDSLGVPYDKRKRKQKKKQQQPAEPQAIHVTPEATAAALHVLPTEQESGMAFKIDDEYDPEEAVSKIMKIASFLEGEKHNFKIRLEITELKE